MRHLYSRNDPGRSSSAEPTSATDARSNSRRPFRQSLPLYGLSADFRSSPTSRAQECGNMRADPREYELVTLGDLRSALALMDREPDTWTPIAGGTDLMVLYSAGKLAARKLVSIWNLPELRGIGVDS